MLPDYKAYYKSYSNQDGVVLVSRLENRQVEQNRICKLIHNQNNFGKRRTKWEILCYLIIRLIIKVIAIRMV